MYEVSRAAERAIDLAILSGLFLAPRRVLLEMALKLEREVEEAAQTEQVEMAKAA